MDHNAHPAVQVVISGRPPPQPAHGPNMSLQDQTRPLSVDEALQYSSMSNAPVFGLGMHLQQLSSYMRTTLTNALLLDCVLRPDVGRPPNATSINHVLQVGRSTLKELDEEIQSGPDESNRLETSREYLQQLLDGDQLTEL